VVQTEQRSCTVILTTRKTIRSRLQGYTKHYNTQFSKARHTFLTESVLEENIARSTPSSLWLCNEKVKSTSHSKTKRHTSSVCKIVFYAA